MVDSYTSTIYKTAAEAVAAINGTATGKLVSVTAFREDGKQKFLVVVAT